MKMKQYTKISRLGCTTSTKAISKIDSQKLNNIVVQGVNKTKIKTEELGQSPNIGDHHIIETITPHKSRAALKTPTGIWIK